MLEKKMPKQLLRTKKKTMYNQAQGHDQGLSCVIKYPMQAWIIFYDQITPSLRWHSYLMRIRAWMPTSDLKTGPKSLLQFRGFLSCFNQLAKTYREGWTFFYFL